MKLSGVVLSKSSQGKKNVYQMVDIKLNSRSKLSVVQKLSFAFDQLTGDDDQKRTLEDFFYLFIWYVLIKVVSKSMCTTK